MYLPTPTQTDIFFKQYGHLHGYFSQSFSDFNDNKPKNSFIKIQHIFKIYS